MTKTAIFGAFIIQDPVTEGANGVNVQDPPGGADAGVEALIVLEESKSPSDRCSLTYGESSRIARERL